jgi:hypothetical protein
MLRTMLVAAALLLTPVVASAQGLAAADAGAFLGEWSVTLDSPQGPFEQTITVFEEDGKVVAEIYNQMQGAQKVADVTMAGDNLVLKFSGDFQGNPFDAAVTMVPDGEDNAKVSFVVNAGMFTMDGPGTRVKKP